MGKKYIVEIGRLERLYKAFIKELGMPELTWLSPEVDLTPYTEPDLEQVRKEAYDKGYHDGHNACYETAKDLMEKKKNEAYQRGLTDAWEAARKIANLVSGEQKRLFDCFGIYSIAHEFSASEAIDKIKAYEDGKQEIKVGDEVEWSGDKYVVTYIHVDETYADVIDCSCGSVCEEISIKNLTKTGRHFPEIAAVLEKMRGEQK